jgi:hypothetical protein
MYESQVLVVPDSSPDRHGQGKAQRILRQLTGGMAAAIVIDATLVRGNLLPAALALLGDRTWSAPRWLRRSESAGRLEARGSAL